MPWVFGYGVRLPSPHVHIMELQLHTTTLSRWECSLHFQRRGRQRLGAVGGGHLLGLPDTDHCRVRAGCGGSREQGKVLEGARGDDRPSSWHRARLPARMAGFIENTSGRPVNSDMWQQCHRRSLTGLPAQHVHLFPSQLRGRGGCDGGGGPDQLCRHAPRHPRIWVSGPALHGVRGPSHRLGNCLPGLAWHA